MKRSLIVSFSVIHVFLGAPVQAATQMTTERLYSLCAYDSQGKEIMEKGQAACQSYIVGVLDYHSTLKALDALKGVDFCIPATATDFELQDIVYRYIGAHARHKGFLAAPTVALALQEAFPCH